MFGVDTAHPLRHERAFRGHDSLHEYPEHARYRAVIFESTYASPFASLIARRLQTFRPTASTMSALKAAAGTFSPSRKSTARTLPLSRRALKSFFGSFIWAPFGKVNRTAFLSISPMHTLPFRDHTGTPSGLEGFFHFTSSTTAGPAPRTIPRSRDSVSPRQSPEFLMMASISSVNPLDALPVLLVAGLRVLLAALIDKPFLLVFPALERMTLVSILEW